MTGECIVCGVRAPDEQLVELPGPRVDRRVTTELYCPTCATNTEAKPLVKRARLLIAGAFAAPVLLAASSQGRLLFICVAVVLGVALCWVVLTVLIAVHELGHVLAARLVGATALAVSIGRGQPVFRAQVLGVDVEVGRTPQGGLTSVVGAEDGWRGSVRLLGGVTLEVGFEIALWWWLGAAGQIFVLFALLSLVGNLWPRTVATSVGPIPNDGAQLMSLLRTGARSASPLTPMEYRAQRDFAQALERGDTDALLALTGAELSASSDSASAQLRGGIALLYAHRYREALDVLLPLLEAEEPNTPQWPLLNNVAFGAVMTFDARLVQDAERWSAEAYELCPVEPAVAHTRAASLVVAGRSAEAIPLLDRVLLILAGPASQRALVAGFRALAAADIGDREAATRYCEMMCSLDPSCPLQARVEDELGRGDPVARTITDTPP